MGILITSIKNSLLIVYRFNFWSSNVWYLISIILSSVNHYPPPSLKNLWNCELLNTIFLYYCPSHSSFCTCLATKNRPDCGLPIIIFHLSYFKQFLSINGFIFRIANQFVFFITGYLHIPVSNYLVKVIQFKNDNFIIKST